MYQKIKPFGESKLNEDVDQDGNIFTLNLRLPGQYFDKETNKHYNRRSVKQKQTALLL